MLDSVMNAFQCAVGVQKKLNARNAELPDNCQMKFCIDSNLGDVIQEGECFFTVGLKPFFSPANSDL